MNRKIAYLAILLFMGLMTLWGCAHPSKEVKKNIPQKPRKQASKASPQKEEEKFQKGYLTRKVEMELKGGRPYLPVGAEIISKEGKVPLNSVIKELASLRGFSVSWAEDVDQNKEVDVNIKPEDNFWSALNNLLRQLDYFYEVEEDTIIIKYKVSKTYHLAMPFLQEDFSTSVGGNLLGGEETEGKMKGEVKLEGKLEKPLNFWKQLEDNLKKIIGDSGSYVIDRPLGIITVTAPQKTHKKVSNYLQNLEKEIYKQVEIEAKIIEVRLDKTHQMGIDWSDVLQRTFTGTIEFGRLYHYEKFVKTITLNSQTFSVFMSALDTYGKTNVISNPKITLLNGHGATITVGENVTYINKVESTVDTETDVITYDVSTSNILSGIGLGVVANVINDKEVILYITPLTSELQEPIEYRTFGTTAQGAEVGLPRIKVKDIATLAKIKEGETLIIGGLIDKTKVKNEKKTPFLGDLPLLKNLFTYVSEETISRELVILLRPRIIK